MYHASSGTEWDPKDASSFIDCHSTTPRRKVFVCVSREDGRGGTTNPSHTEWSNTRTASVLSSVGVSNVPDAAQQQQAISPTLSRHSDPTSRSVTLSTSPEAIPFSPQQSPPPWERDMELGSIRRLRVEDSYDRYVVASLAQSSPQVLATYRPGGAVSKPVEKRDSVRDSAGHRLHSQAIERAKKMQLLRERADERERNTQHCVFAPKISAFAKKRRPSANGSVFDRLADEDVVQRREHQLEAEAKEGVKAASEAHIPTITSFPAKVERMGVLEEQTRWEEGRRKHIEELRAKADTVHQFAPKLNPVSQELVSAMKAERGPVHDRLIQVGEEARRRRDEAANCPPPRQGPPHGRAEKEGAAVFLDQVMALCGEPPQSAAHVRLYHDAAERERGLEELRRERELSEIAKCTSAQQPFTPRINRHSAQMVAGEGRSTSGGSSYFDHRDTSNRHAGCVSAYQLEEDTKVIVNEVAATMSNPQLSTYSEALAHERYAREGLLHLSVHERLAHQPSSSRSTTPPHPSRRQPSSQLYSFSPSINRHSSQLDQRVVRSDHQGSAVSRIDHLYEKQQDRDRRVEAQRREQEEFERGLSSHVSTVIRGRMTPASDSGRELAGTSISERSAMWHQKREAKLTFQRAAHDRETIADCTFTPAIVGKSTPKRRVPGRT